MWSLITETKKGLDNLTEALPMTIDAQYTSGFSWASQPGIRVVRKFNDHFWVGASIENPSTTLWSVIFEIRVNFKRENLYFARSPNYSAWTPKQ